MLNEIGNHCRSITAREHASVYINLIYRLYLWFPVYRCSQTPATFSAISAPSTWGRELTLVPSVGRRLPLRQASSSISTFTAVSNPLAVSQSSLNETPTSPFVLTPPKSAAFLTFPYPSVQADKVFIYLFIYLPLFSFIHQGSPVIF